MSHCDFPGQFTCRDGGCVDIFKRCNIRNDCDDGSDEDGCKTLKVPSNYDVSIPPELGVDEDRPNEIYTHVEVINVDEVSTVKMSIGLTVRITFKWRDPNVEFENIKNHENDRETRMIPAEEKDMLWTPLPKLIHDNAMIGEVKVIDFFNFGIDIDNEAKPMDSTLSEETQIYPGDENTLVISQRMRLNYRCNFFLVDFPFDETVCDFYLSLRLSRNNSIRMTNDENSVTYEGPKTLNEFKIVEIWSRTVLNQTKTTFIYSMKFKRLSEQYLMTIFFQSSILWILSYITLFIDLTDFSNRFMGAVTALLVLAALLASLGDLLPKTAYFKFIDVWFNWFIANILVIILIHVVIDYLNKNVDFDSKSRRVEGSALFRKNQGSVEERTPNSGSKLNTTLKILLPVLNMLFVCVYFIVSTNNHDEQ